MPLSCGCDIEYEPGMTICYPGEDFEPLQTTRRQRCQSCKELINIGDFSVRFEIFKVPEYQVEIDIYGEDGEIPRAPRYLCEECGEIDFNLKELGFECIWVGEDMRELLKEYRRIYKPQKLQ